MQIDKPCLHFLPKEECVYFQILYTSAGKSHRTNQFGRIVCLFVCYVFCVPNWLNTVHVM